MVRAFNRAIHLVYVITKEANQGNEVEGDDGLVL